MPDKIDYLDEMEEEIKEKQISIIRLQADLDPGMPGDCELCGEYSERLIKGACAPCRDKYKLL